MNYNEWTNQKQKEFNEIPLKFAFSDEQLDRVLSELELTRENYAEKVEGYYGGIILKEKAYMIGEWQERYAREFKELMKDSDFIKSMFMYELGNHEWQLTGDDEEVLNACGCLEEVKNDPELMKIWKKSKAEYWQNCLDNDWF